ncbi:unnamed protein product [Staurois parvus]|uniref:Uncharacterized protein n=1 Tax=Staurois parvus TaxID=386267 RepID=A0ABN9E4U1_9NEOB|nr:unnamed protein product [Staurois parvus]
MSLESWVGAVLRPDSTAKVPLSPREPDVFPSTLCGGCAEVRPHRQRPVEFL